MSEPENVPTAVGEVTTPAATTAAAMPESAPKSEGLDPPLPTVAPPIPEVAAAAAPPAAAATVTSSTVAAATAPPPPVAAAAAPPPVAVATRAPAKPPAVAAPAPTVATTRRTVVTAAPAPVSSMAAATTTSTSSRSSKSKKKKSLAAAAAAAAGANSSGAGNNTGGQGENTGRWTAEEHRLFLEGLEQHGKGWKKIASLIKSRTVVQIRTHAQKYFQKLAKARQNGEEGDVTMEGRGGGGGIGGHPFAGMANLGSGVGGGISTASAVAQQTKRRARQTSGTKRKAIQSVVVSVQRQAKKLAQAQAASKATAEGVAAAAAAAVPNPVVPLPAVAPTLAHFLLPHALQPPVDRTSKSNSASSSSFSTTTAQGVISGPALEDSIFRFLTPAPVVPMDQQASVAAVPPQVNDVARQAGANPITLPTENPSTAPATGGEVSPTGVADFGTGTNLSIYPSWTDAKDIPTWYAKGADVDALLDVGDSLDWLADSGDLHETYQAPPTAPPAPEPQEQEEVAAAPLPDLDSSQNKVSVQPTAVQSHVANSTSVNEFSKIVGAPVETVVPPLPSIFDGAPDSTSHLPSVASAATASTTATAEGGSSKTELVPSASAVALAAAADPTTAGLQEPLFDTPMEEHDFVSTILEESESAADLVGLT